MRKPEMLRLMPTARSPIRQTRRSLFLKANPHLEIELQDHLTRMSAALDKLDRRWKILQGKDLRDCRSKGVLFRHPNKRFKVFAAARGGGEERRCVTNGLE